MENRTYRILTEKQEEVTKKLKRLEKKAQKYNVPFSYSYGEPYALEIAHMDDFGQKYVNKYEVVDLTINSEEIKKDGYTVLAHIEHGDNGNIVNTFHGETVAEWVTRAPYCEHCNSNHGLKVTFMVSNGNETKQVGRTCLKDYCGIDPQMIGMFNEFYEDMEEYDAERCGISLGFPCVYECVDVLALAMDIINEQGYIKSSEPKSNKSILNKRLGEKKDPTEESKIKATEMVKAISEMTIDESVDARLNNIKVRIDNEYCKASDFGYFAYAPLAYNRYIERKEEQEKRSEAKKQMSTQSEYVGTVGERSTFDISKMELLTSFPTDYGYTFLYRFFDTKGNVLIWFASSPMLDKDCKEITSVERIKATVKNHAEREGVKQTVLTRVKIA